MYAPETITLFVTLSNSLVESSVHMILFTQTHSLRYFPYSALLCLNKLIPYFLCALSVYLPLSHFLCVNLERNGSYYRGRLRFSIILLILNTIMVWDTSDCLYELLLSQITCNNLTLSELKFLFCWENRKYLEMFMLNFVLVK